MMRKLCILIILSLLSACAGMPESLRGDYSEQPAPDGIRSQSSAQFGQQVRWGGVILNVKNLSDSTVMNILAFPLDDNGRPETDQPNQGRILVKLSGFLDPATFEAKREVSVVGIVQGLETHTIGEYKYRYPVLQGKSVHLWPKPSPHPERYDPWYPWGPYPGYAPLPYYRGY